MGRGLWIEVGLAGCLACTSPMSPGTYLGIYLH